MGKESSGDDDAPRRPLGHHLGAEALTALGATACNDLLAILGGHAGAKSVTTLAHEAAWLVGALHGCAP